jgi:glutamine amidotransferase
MQVAIIDYGLGNLRSVEKAFAQLGVETVLTEQPEPLGAADALVLPGVGAFGDGMAGLSRRDLVTPIRDQVASGKPLLGICLGLQLFFQQSEENPGVVGLGLLDGEVLKFEGEGFGAGSELKVPHMGWNTLNFPGEHPVFAGLPETPWVYFVHSYYVRPDRQADVIAESDYGGRFCAVAGRERIVGCQFHPEKSQAVGLKVLENFLAWARD